MGTFDRFRQMLPALPKRRVNVSSRKTPHKIPSELYEPGWAWVQSPEFAHDLATYLFNEWVSTAIDRLAELCISVPIEVRTHDGMELVEDHPLMQLLGPYGQPNPFQDSIEFLESHFQRVDIFGNDVWYWSSAGGGPPDSVYQLDLRKLSIRHTGAALVYEYRTGSGVFDLDVTRITHFRRSNSVGSSMFWGISALQKLRALIQQDANMVKWNSEFFQIGAPSGLLMLDASLVSAQDRDAIEAELFSKATDGRRMVVIRASPGGALFQNIFAGHRDVDFSAGRLLMRQAAFDALGFHVGAVSEASTEAHARVAERLVRTSAYIRHLRSASRLNQALQFWEGWDKLQVKYHDVRTVDWDMEAKKLLSVRPYMTINEIRSSYLNLPAIPEGDVFAKVGKGTTGAERELPPNQYPN